MFPRHSVNNLTVHYNFQNFLIKGQHFQSFRYFSKSCTRNPGILFTRKQLIVNNHVRQLKDPKPVSFQSVRCASSFSERLTSISESIALSWPVQKCTDSLIWIHDVTGLPWWMSIIVSTFIFRTLIVFPFMCYDRRITHKLINVGPEISAYTEKVAEELKKKVNKGQLKKEKFRITLLRAYKKKSTQIYIDNNVHPGQRVVLIAFQFPFWITMSSSLNNLCIRPYLLNDALIHNQFFTGGVAWFSNLTVPDPFYVLPGLFFASILSSIKLAELIKKQNRPINVLETKLEKYVTLILKGWTVALLGISAFTPAGCVLYWATSAACGTLHHYILSFPKVRKAFRIPPIKNDPRPLDWKRLMPTSASKFK